ncbi:MAG TPA: DUF2058 domain-containing protein [Steroidobacteraceae bacterium]|nr:DUF2058 domain-containing protein [Steroidobacteraceae bacterium]
MSLSLREQLLAAGLVNKKQVEQAEKQKSQQEHKAKKDKSQTQSTPKPPVLTAAQRAEAAKVARDKELNRKKEEKAARRARAVAINQLVEQNRIPRVADENPDFYNFVDGGKIHRIAIKGDTREKILGGELLVVRFRGFFALVPKDTAEKIRAIDPNAVLEHKSETNTSDENDPYKNFVVPDDLKW